MTTHEMRSRGETKSFQSLSRYKMPWTKNPNHERGKVQLRHDKLFLDGKTCSIDNLDSLPVEFRPETLCTKTNNNITEFFRRGSPLSNHYICQFTLNGERYNSAEQYLMTTKAELFGDHDSVVAIKRESNPRVQKELGKKVKNFNRDTWISEAPRILFNGLLEKFKQNDNLTSYLLGTGRTSIVEANPNDLLFGAGVSRESPQIWHKENWKGKNILGMALEKVRTALSEQ